MSLRRSFFQRVFVLIFIILILYGGVIWRYGTCRSALSALRGELVQVDSKVKSFGAIGKGEQLLISFYLKNLSMRPARLVGSRAFCTCTMPDDLPMTLDPGRAYVFNVRVKPQEEGPFHARILIFTNIQSQPQINLDILGEVKPRGPSASGH